MMDKLINGFNESFPIKSARFRPMWIRDGFWSIRSGKERSTAVRMTLLALAYLRVGGLRKSWMSRAFSAVEAQNFVINEDVG